MNIDINKQAALAEKFHTLHHAGKTLILPNAWDCISAKIFEKEGFPAIATSSASVSWAYGYPDGEIIPPDMMIDAIQKMSRCTDLPLTADIEGGFIWDDLTQFKAFIRQVIESGAVGINLEDSSQHFVGLNKLELQKQRIKTAKEAGKELGINFYLNARVDAMSAMEGKSLDEKIQTTIERAKAYREAGADGIFVPFISDIEIIRKLKPQIGLPLNILSNVNLNVTELKAIGVERISIGSRPAMSIYAKLKEIAHSVHSSDNWKPLFDNGITYEEMNVLMAKK